MMAKIRVSILTPSTLRLEEDAKKGDVVDLRELESVDTSLIFEAIKEQKDEIYRQMLDKEIEHQASLRSLALSKQMEAFNQQRSTLEQEKQKLSQQIVQLNDSIKDQKDIAVLEERNKKEREINLILGEKEKQIDHLNAELTKLNERQQLLIDNEKSNLKSEYDKLVNDKEKQLLMLESEIARLKASEKENLREKEAELRILSEQIKNKDQLLKVELERKEAELQLKFNRELNIKENELNQLKMAKSNLQVKVLGEELERWCNSEYEAFALSGFEDCRWYKDNKAVKDAPDQKGTKADYIFEVYANENRLARDLLLSVVCEMKNESPDTKTKTKNADHYKKLNDDRIKKNGQYALLISELEWDTINDSPIKKISEYENMYMVRPSYFITFLALIKSLAKKYQALLVEHRIADESFKDGQAIIEEFEKFKNTYLDKPLESLVKDVESIKNEANKAYESSYKIMGLADTIISNKISEIKIKIERFDIKKIAKKIDKLS